MKISAEKRRALLLLDEELSNRGVKNDVYRKRLRDIVKSNDNLVALDECIAYAMAIYSATLWGMKIDKEKEKPKLKKRKMFLCSSYE